VGAPRIARSRKGSSLRDVLKELEKEHPMHADISGTRIHYLVYTPIAVTSISFRYCPNFRRIVLG
jgi:hypothetical protein